MLPSPPLTPQLPGLQTRDWADGGAPGWRRSLSLLDGGRVWGSLHLSLIFLPSSYLFHVGASALPRSFSSS